MEKIETDWNDDFEKYSPEFFSKYTNDDVAPLILILYSVTLLVYLIKTLIFWLLFLCVFVKSIDFSQHRRFFTINLNQGKLIFIITSHRQETCFVKWQE